MTDTMTHDPESCMAAAAVGEAHKKLDPFVGTFRATVKLWMGPGEPMVSTGTMVNSWDLGGRFLKQVYTGDPNPGPFPNFEGRGFWGYNNVTRRYEGFWIDNASTFMNTEVGDLDAAGKTWTMVGEMADPQGSGKSMRKRSVIALKDRDHHSLEMFFTMPDGQECKTMEIQYQRVR
jgi:hypothetical protein